MLWQREKSISQQRNFHRFSFIQERKKKATKSFTVLHVSVEPQIVALWTLVLLTLISFEEQSQTISP